MVKAVSLPRVGLRPSERRAIRLHATPPRLPQRHPQQAVDKRTATSTTSSSKGEENHPVGGIAFQAKEVAEGIPAASAALRINLKGQRRSVFGIWLMPFRPLVISGVAKQQNTDDFARVNVTTAR